MKKKKETELQSKSQNPKSILTQTRANIKFRQSIEMEIFI